MRNKYRKNWMLGFLSLISIEGFIGLFKGNWLDAIWIVWLVWTIYFFPVKQ